jgi:hypothetical protein
MMLVLQIGSLYEELHFNLVNRYDGRWPMSDNQAYTGLQRLLANIFGETNDARCSLPKLQVRLTDPAVSDTHEDTGK